MPAVDVSSATQPIQAIPVFGDEDYKRNLTFLFERYNGQINNVPIIGAGGGISNGSTNYITEYFDNLQYKIGAQTPADFAFFIRDYNGNNTQVPLVRGLEIKAITDYLNGEIVKMIRPLPKMTVARAYSSNALSAKKEALDYAFFQIKNKLQLKSIEDASGYGFKAVNKDFKNPKQEQKFFENFMEGMEIAVEYMAKDSLYKNQYRVVLPKQAEHVAYGNLCCTWISYRNGRPVWEIVPPEEAVIDYSKGFDNHINDDYAGQVFRMTLQDVFARWNFDATEQAKLKAIANNDQGQYAQFYAPYQNGLAWFVNNNGVRKVTVVRGRWVSQELKEDGQYKEVIREGYYIGGCYLRDCGLMPGQYSKKEDKSKKSLNVAVFTPGLLMGTSVSIVGIVKRYQNLKDAFITKTIAMAASAIGKAAIIRADKLPPGMNSPTFLSQLKQAGAIVVEGTDVDDPGADPKRMVEVVDLTIDPAIAEVLKLAQYFEAQIQNFVNLPPSVRGQMSGYQSTDVVQNVQEQSNKGLAYFFEGFMLFCQQVEEISANLYKTMAPDDELGRENLSMLIGDGLTELLGMEDVRRAQFEDFDICLMPDNYSGETDKNNLIDLMKQVASGQMPRKVLLDYIKLNRIDSRTEQENYLEEQIYNDDQKELAAQKAQMENAQENTQMNVQGQQQIQQQQAQMLQQIQQMKDEIKKYEIDSKAKTSVEVADVVAESKALTDHVKMMIAELQKKNEPVEAE